MANNPSTQSADAAPTFGQPRAQIRLDNDKVRGRVTGFCSSKDYIAATLDDGKIHVFNRGGEDHKVLDPQSRAVWSSAIWEKTLVSGDRDGNVVVWDLESGQQLRKLTGHTATVRCIKMHDANTAISASRDGTLRIWDIAQGDCRHIFEGHTATVRALDVSGDFIVSGSDDKTARVWNAAQGRSLHILSGHEGGLFVVVADGKRIATGSVDKSIRIWDLETGACTAVLRAHESLVSRLDLQDGILTSGGADGVVCAWVLNEAEPPSGPRYRISASGNSITSLQVRNGKIYTGDSEGLVKLWNAQDGTPVGQIGPAAEAVYKVFASDDRVIVLAARDGTCVMEIWENPRG